MLRLPLLAGVLISEMFIPAYAADELPALFVVPSSIRSEHGELHETLERAQREEGPLGASAKALAAQLEPHFEKEEQMALPPLGLLPALAQGNTSEEMRPAIEMADRLKADYATMLQEHQQIVVVLTRFRDAAQDAGKNEYVDFADNLAQHAKTEEEILYPTALLIGEYIRLQLDPLR